MAGGAAAGGGLGGIGCTGEMTKIGEVQFRVDIENPGDFFACMGVLYCADKIFNRATGHFEGDRFVLDTDSGGNPLEDILAKINSDHSEEPLECDDSGDKASPVILRSMNIRLDFWNHFDERPKIKLFSGQEKSLVIVGRWIPHLRQVGKVNDMRDFAVTCLPSGLDTATSWRALDVGFSLNDLKIGRKTYPLIEFFAYIGVQTYGWKFESKQKCYYTVWQTPLPFVLARAVGAGALVLSDTIRLRFECEKNGQKDLLTRGKRI